MSYITRNHKQNVTYWSPGSNDGFGGVTFGTPVTVKGRWEDKAVLFIDASGNEVTSIAKIYLGIDVVLKGYLFEGETTAANPNTVSNAREIRSFRRIPNLKATEFERLALV